MENVSIYRNQYFDFLRGIAILMVIGIHTFSASAASFDTVDGTFQIMVRQLLNTAVPLFLAISAFFLGRKSLNTKFERMNFWKKQISKVYIPCLIWSLPLLILEIVSGGNVIKQTALLLICGFSIYYFIALIIQYYILLPWLQPFRKRLVALSAVMSGLSIITVTYVTAIKGYSLPLIIYAGSFPLWLLFFVLGGVSASYKMEYKLVYPILLSLIGVLLSYFESRFLTSFHGVGFGIKLSSFIYSSGVILALFNHQLVQTYNAQSKFNKIIAFIGRISFGVYLMHCYVILVLNKIYPSDSWLLSWLIVSLATIIIIMVVRKLLPPNLLKYIGFQ